MIQTNFYSFLGSLLVEKEWDRKDMVDMGYWPKFDARFNSIFFAIFLLKPEMATK